MWREGFLAVLLHSLTRELMGKPTPVEIIRNGAGTRISLGSASTPTYCSIDPGFLIVQPDSWRERSVHERMSQADGVHAKMAF